MVHEHTAQLRNQQANTWVPQTLLAEAEMRAESGQCKQTFGLLGEEGFVGAGCFFEDGAISADGKERLMAN